MDLLRFLMMLPVRLARQLRDFLRGGLPPVVGKVSWTPPPWIPALRARIASQPERFWGGTLVAVLVVIAGIGGYQWYLHRPHPPEPERITFDGAGARRSRDYERGDGAPTSSSIRLR